MREGILHGVLANLTECKEAFVSLHARGSELTNDMRIDRH
jgi:hypothetical protein